MLSIGGPCGKKHQLTPEYAQFAVWSPGPRAGMSAIEKLSRVKGVRPDRWDITGAAVCLLGAAIIVFGRNALTA